MEPRPDQISERKKISEKFRNSTKLLRFRSDSGSDSGRNLDPINLISLEAGFSVFVFVGNRPRRRKIGNRMRLEMTDYSNSDDFGRTDFSELATELTFLIFNECFF